MKQEKFSATALLFPSLLMALIVLGYPVLELLNTSTHSVNKFFNVGDFVLFQNYVNLFQDEFFRAALLRTLWWTLGVVGGTVLLSFPIAMILNEDFHGQAVARTIILLPWAVSLTIMAVVWRWALNGESGLLNLTLQSLGITSERIQWLAESSTSFPMAILIGILVSIPFTVTVLLGGLSSLPKDVYEAARVDGASGRIMFTHITLPMMKPFVSIAVVLNVIYVFNSFPILWVLTEGGPVNSTDVLVTYLYKATSAKFFGDPGKGAALGIIMLILLLIFSLVYARIAREGDEVRA
ncbi:carbohydrate ABC transporter permease [Deinococcus cellulosilyticus]|uniref:ABC transporter permease n=1 Tax=Deinococcus cellulosilyticus (strain DSM 18568 / NBRC 106333 / KACC 11606 / 5516J-15) TaxID=1223518 RepID=A0A511N143_DEIC1|nr:sugar ABC transporter permease [Deinococcus cellulosilyticus]GEM46580.1 ABC transporter permease [Deinococcus cellulosilyticus NBRC 106333 = KACC 11606]